MTRCRAWLGLSLALILVGQPVLAQVSRSGLISSTEVNRFGLDRVWHTQIALDRARGRISHLAQHISSTRAQTIFRVVDQQGEVEFSERELDSFGVPLGRMGAARRAAERLVDVITVLLVSKPEGIDEAALKETQQAAQQVVYDVNSALNTTPGALPSATGTPPPTDVDQIIAPLMRRTSATPDAVPRLEMDVIPDITIFVTTDRGMLHALDGETGSTRWATPVGHRSFASLAPVANDRFVAVVNGSAVYLFEYDTGKLVLERWMQGVAGAPPAMSDNMMYIPTLSGLVEAYRINAVNGRFPPPTKFYSTGRGMVQPTVVHGSVGWPTDRGFFYVADATQLNKRFRLEAHRTIVSQASYLPGRFIVASLDGFVYCVHEFTGALLWRFSTGVPVSHTPIVIGETIYVIVDEGGMYSVDGNTGVERWWTPNIRRFIAASEDRLYCTDRLGRIVILHAETGGRMASLPTEQLDLFFTNWQTDRIFMGDRTGLLQCVRESQQTHPIFHISIEDSAQPTTPDSPDGAPDAGAPTGQPGSFGGNPFGGDLGVPAGDNPFGTGSPSANPFGTGSGDANPFGTPPTGGTGGDNPFGTPPAGSGGGNPFGSPPAAGGGTNADNPFGP